MRFANHRVRLFTLVFTLIAFQLAIPFGMGFAESPNDLMDVILPVNTISYLPLDREEPGRVPVEANFTETGYQDETIIVEVETVHAYNSTFHVAYVKIATPTQLRTAIAGSRFGSSRTLKPTVFSQSMNAIVLINGDYYAKTKAGYIVRQGETYREATSKNMDLLLVDENADFHIILRGHDNQKAGVRAYLEQHEIINGFFFGPALVVDGELQEIPDHYQFNPFGDEPRAAIGQLAPLTYALVTVDGRIADSEGVTQPELAAFMQSIGCEQAYGLDGGNSSALVFHHRLVSIKDVSERDVSDVIYFASAIDN